MRARERGSALIEGILVIFILAMIFVGLSKLGHTALEQQKLQAEVDNRAWSRALGTAPQSQRPTVEREFLGWRASDKSSKKRSFRIDVADGF